MALLPLPEKVATGRGVISQGARASLQQRCVQVRRRILDPDDELGGLARCPMFASGSWIGKADVDAAGLAYTCGPSLVHWQRLSIIF
jgi:hypothetical protein